MESSEAGKLKKLRDIEDSRLYAKVGEHCVQDKDGKVVRGSVSRITCHICKQDRWNDGMPCQTPTGLKMNGGICGAYPRDRFNADDESRI